MLENPKSESIKHKIIIIGGGSFQGKSLIAMRLAYEFKIPYVISTDTIRNILLKLHQDNPPRYLSTSTYLLTPTELEQQKIAVSNLIKEILDIYNERGENLIIEGMHLTKDFVKYIYQSYRDKAFLICLNNTLPLYKRIKYKQITRSFLEYRDKLSGKIKYANFTNKEIIKNMPYLKYEKRIQKIHQEIVGYYQKYGKIITFTNIVEAEEKILNLVGSWLNKN